MCRMFSLVLLATLVVAGSGAAAADLPVLDDAMGIFFDQEAWSVCETPELPGFLTAYLIYVNPSHGQIHGWEAAVRTAGTSDPAVVGTETFHGGTNDLAGSEFSVGFAAPLATETVTVLGSVTLFAPDPPYCLFLTGVAEPSVADPWPLVWPDPGMPVPVATTDLIGNNVEAYIGDCQSLPEDPVPSCDGVVSAVGTGWGALKASYR